MKLSDFLSAHSVTHIPVLFDPVMEFFDRLGPSPLVVDGTLGEAGHTRGFLSMRPEARVIAFDRDAQMIERARSRLLADGFRLSEEPEPGAVHIVRSSFSEVPEVLGRLDLQADFVLCDFGVAMFHFQESSRGFAFRDEALDMRLDDRLPVTAADLVNSSSEEELSRIFYEYGEERQSRSIAHNIVRNRPVTSASRLTDLVLQTLIRSRDRKGGRGFIRDSDAVRVFQALRIAVNSELEEISGLVASLGKVLMPGGLGAMISFHSLEDRLVKKGFQSLPREEYRIITKKPIVPEDSELQINPAARSAKLRVLERKMQVAQR